VIELSTGPAASAAQPRREAAPLRFSVVIAVFNEAENVVPVTQELLRAAGAIGLFEVIFVDDGSSDDTVDRLRALRAQGDPIRILRHDRRCGKTAALVTGIAAARAPWIVTMDGDGQDNPGEIPGMLQAAWSDEQSPLVAGIRTRRNDPLPRRIATRFANGLRQKLLRDGCPDTACGFKAFRRDDFLRLPAFEGMHRFLPALFQTYGHPLVCYPVAHRARLKGRSKYTNFGRALVGIADLLGAAAMSLRILPRTDAWRLALGSCRTLP
jgi:dolichol-phosphate mannosyltransferase